MLIPNVVVFSQQVPEPKPAVVDLRVGNGRTVQLGDRVTVRITAKTPSGKTLVDTQKRGLSYTFEYDPSRIEAWQKEVVGMKQGGVRTIKIDGLAAGPKKGETLIVTVRLIEIVPGE